MQFIKKYFSRFRNNQIALAISLMVVNMLFLVDTLKYADTLLGLIIQASYFIALFFILLELFYFLQLGVKKLVIFLNEKIKWKWLKLSYEGYVFEYLSKFVILCLSLYIGHSTIADHYKAGYFADMDAIKNECDTGKYDRCEALENRYTIDKDYKELFTYYKMRCDKDDVYYCAKYIEKYVKRSLDKYGTSEITKYLISKSQSRVNYYKSRALYHKHHAILYSILKDNMQAVHYQRKAYELIKKSSDSKAIIDNYKKRLETYINRQPANSKNSKMK